MSNNHPGWGQSDEEQRAAADAALKATETPSDQAIRKSWGLPIQPQGPAFDREQWAKGSRKGSTREMPRTGVASLDSVQVDANNSPFDFADAIQQAGTIEQTQAARVLAGENPDVVEQTPTQPLTQSLADALWEKLEPVVRKVEAELASGKARPARVREIQAAQRTIEDLRKLPVADSTTLSERLARLNGLVTGLDASQRAEERAIAAEGKKLYGERTTGEESFAESQALFKKCDDEIREKRRAQP